MPIYSHQFQLYKEMYELYKFSWCLLIYNRGSPSKSTSPKSDAVFVVGLEKTGSRLGRPPNTPNRFEF